MKRIFLQIVCMMAAVLCSARTVTTFDFTKPDADNKLFGVELLNNWACFVWLYRVCHRIRTAKYKNFIHRNNWFFRPAWPII